MEMHDSHDGYFIRNESSNPPKQYKKTQNEHRKKSDVHMYMHVQHCTTNTSSPKHTRTHTHTHTLMFDCETRDKNVTLILAFRRLYTIHQFNSADLTIDYVFLVSYSRYFSPNSMLRIPKPPSFFCYVSHTPHNLYTNKNHIVYMYRWYIARETQRQRLRERVNEIEM